MTDLRLPLLLARPTRATIEDMKMSWPFAFVVGVALAAVVAIKAMGGETGDVLSIVSLMFNAVLLLELREVKNQTNGTTSDLAAENRRLSLRLQSITDRALDSGPLQPPPESTRSTE